MNTKKIKHLLLFFLFYITIFLNFLYAQSKNNLLVWDSISKQQILVGEVNFNTLDASFYTFWVNAKAKTKIVPALLDEKKDSTIQYLTFFGSWCGDSKEIIPEFIQYLIFKEKSLENQLFFALDRKKQGTNSLSKLFNISRVPTIIAFQNGKELFRIIEFGDENNWQKSLLKHLNQ